MTRNKPGTFLATAAVIPLTALAVPAAAAAETTAGSAPRQRRRTDEPRPSASRTAASGRSSTTHTAAPCTCSEGLGTKSACAGACASAWPPLRVSGKPTVGAGATASMLRTLTALRRQGAGHLQRPPALHLHRRPEPRRHERPGPDELRRRLVRPVSGRNQMSSQMVRPMRKPATSISAGPGPGSK